MIKDIFKKFFGTKPKEVAMQDLTATQTKSPVVVPKVDTCIQVIRAKESPKQILSEDFPRHQWPISGGWGYTKEDAVVLEIDNSFEGVAFEYKFLEYRTYEEGIIFRSPDSQLAGFRFETIGQALVNGEHGKHYDRIEMKATAFAKSDYEYLKKDWEQHGAYKDDPEGEERHQALADSKRLEFKVIGWFDITRFFGK